MVSTIGASKGAVKPDNLNLQRAGLIAELVYNCLSITADTVRDVQHHFNLTVAEIEGFNVRSVPTQAQNIIISHSCLDSFGPDALTASGLFYSFTREGSVCTCFDWSTQCHCVGETWRLDVSPTYQRGVLFPVKDTRFGVFTDLLVYRHVRDEVPFSLRVHADRRLVA